MMAMVQAEARTMRMLLRELEGASQKERVVAGTGEATVRLDAVGNGALHALEEEQAAEEDYEDGGGAGD